MPWPSGSRFQARTDTGPGKDQLVAPHEFLEPVLRAGRTGEDRFVVHPGLEDFEGDPPSDGSILPSHEHDANPAFANLLQQPIVPDLLPGLLASGGRRCTARVVLGGRAPSWRVDRWRCHEAVFLMMFKQPLDRRP